jgi:maltose/moltooligosaccharide transporter
MSMHAPAPGPEKAADQGEKFKVGTLSYTKAGLITVFLYLLWGDFCFTLMETVVPSVLPVKFNGLDAPNWVLGLILTTIPNLMATVINPIISFRSDRLRSRWGRRIPFLAGATPFLTVFLILLGYSESIGRWIHAALMEGSGSELTTVLFVIGTLVVCFQFFNLFITSVYYYLFNDVVPHAFLGRFLALFRMVGTLAGALFNYFVFQFAESHMQEIFLYAALLYFVAFMVMCWKVREGNYPPPDENADGRRGLAADIKTYAKECFTHRFYWYFFLANSAYAMTWVSGSFGVLAATKVIGLDLATFGKIGGAAAIISLVLLYPAGIISDRFHPLRVLLGSTVAQAMLAPFSIAFLFLRGGLSDGTALAIYLGISLIGIPIGTLHNASELPMFMKLLPQERYGQFCSANALVRSVALMGGGLACGAFLDLVKPLGAVPELCYRFVPVWNLFWVALSGFFYFRLYREWKRLGGETGYQPPMVAGPAPGDG